MGTATLDYSMVSLEPNDFFRDHPIQNFIDQTFDTFDHNRDWIISYAETGTELLAQKEEGKMTFERISWYEEFFHACNERSGVDGDGTDANFDLEDTAWVAEHNEIFFDWFDN